MSLEFSFSSTTVGPIMPYPLKSSCVHVLEIISKIQAQSPPHNVTQFDFVHITRPVNSWLCTLETCCNVCCFWVCHNGPGKFQIAISGCYRMG
jgi:hypothetical protein